MGSKRGEKTQGEGKPRGRPCGSSTFNTLGTAVVAAPTRCKQPIPVVTRNSGAQQRSFGASATGPRAAGRSRNAGGAAAGSVCCASFSDSLQQRLEPPDLRKSPGRKAQQRFSELITHDNGLNGSEVVGWPKLSLTHTHIQTRADPVAHICLYSVHKRGFAALFPSCSCFVHL